MYFLDSLSPFHLMIYFTVELNDLYAFTYRPNYDALINGWTVYSSEAEYLRMGVPNAQWQMTKVNEAYQVYYNKYIIYNI